MISLAKIAFSEVANFHVVGMLTDRKGEKSSFSGWKLGGHSQIQYLCAVS